MKSLFVKNDDWRWTQNPIIRHRFGICLCPFLCDVCNVMGIVIFILTFFYSSFYYYWRTHFSLDFNSSIKASYGCLTFTGRGHNIRRFSTKSLKQFKLTLSREILVILGLFMTHESKETGFNGIDVNGAGSGGGGGGGSVGGDRCGEIGAGFDICESNIFWRISSMHSASLDSLLA